MTRRRTTTATTRTPAPADLELADRVHGAAIRLLRALRTSDDADGLTAPRASALSVLVFGGPLTLGALAAAEQVRPPTMTRLVQEMVRDGLVRVKGDPADGRIKQAEATAKGRKLLLEGRDRRVRRLAQLLASSSAVERRTLDAAARLIRELAPRL